MKVMRGLLLLILIVGTFQQIKKVETPVDIEDLDEENELRADGLIKIKPKILNASRGLSGYMQLTGQDFISFTKNSSDPEGFFVFFGTDWCGHCKNFKPIFEELSYKVEQRDQPNQARPKFIYYQVEKNSEEPAKLFRVNGYPSLYFIFNNLYWEFEGKRVEEEIFPWLDKVKNGEISGGKHYPETLPTFSENFVEGVNDFVRVLKLHYTHNFAMFLVIIGIFLVVVCLCCMTIYQLATESRGDVVEDFVKKTK